jgi:ribosomal protein L40E
MIDLILMYLGMKGARKYEEKTRLICAECGSEQPLKAKFCGKCGKRSLVQPSQYRKIQDIRRDAEIADLTQRQRRNLAINRIKQLSAATICTNCNTYDEHSSAFCTSCGANIASTTIPDESLFQVVQTELPDVCTTWEEFLTLKNASPEKGVVAGLLGRGLTKLIRKQGIGSIE